MNRKNFGFLEVSIMFETGVLINLGLLYLIPPYDKVVCDVHKWVFATGIKHFMPK